MYRLIELLDQMDRVKLTSCCADSASDTPVLIDDGCSASEAARSLSLELFLCKGEALVSLCAHLGSIYLRDLTLDVVPADMVEVEIGLVECLVLSSVSCECLSQH